MTRELINMPTKPYGQELEPAAQQTTEHMPNIQCQHDIPEFLFLTGALFGEAAGVSEQLEGLLEARCMLGGSVGGLDVRDEGAHLPLGLAGGRREQTLVALVQRTSANRLCHRQDGDLEKVVQKIQKVDAG